MQQDPGLTMKDKEAAMHTWLTSSHETDENSIKSKPTLQIPDCVEASSVELR